MKIVNIDMVEKTVPEMEGAEKIYKQVPISKNDGSPAFSFRVISFDPGGHSPYHTHPGEHLYYVISGEGAIVTETGEERPFRKGDFALILPDEKHQYRNKSATESLVMICAVPIDYE
jgi:quercetin dioxygenase-like cupin family protein